MSDNKPITLIAGFAFLVVILGLVLLPTVLFEKNRQQQEPEEKSLVVGRPSEDEKPPPTRAEEIIVSIQKRMNDFEAMNVNFRNDQTHFPNTPAMKEWEELAQKLGYPPEWRPFETLAQGRVREEKEGIAAKLAAEEAKVNMVRIEQETMKELAEIRRRIDDSTESLGYSNVEDLLIRRPIGFAHIHSAKDLPDDIKNRVDALFERREDKHLAEWFLDQAHYRRFAQGGGDAPNEVYEHFWLWCASSTAGDVQRAESSLEEAITDASRIPDSAKKIAAVAPLAGWLCVFKQDEAALRVLTVGHNTDARQNVNTLSFFPAMACLLGRNDTGEAWFTAAQSGANPWGMNTYIAYYYGMSRQFDEAVSWLDGEFVDNDALTAGAIAWSAALAGNRDIYARTMQHTSKVYGNETDHWKGLVLISAHAVSGDFDLAEAEASKLPNAMNFRAKGYGNLAREYALAGQIVPAHTAFRNAASFPAPQTLEAAFYIWEARVRSGSESLAALYRLAIDSPHRSLNVARLAGIAAGLHDALPRAEKRFPMYECE